MKMIIARLLGVLICLLIASCGNSTEVYTARVGQKIRYECAPRKIEVGLKFLHPVVQEYLGGRPLIDALIESEVRVLDAKTMKVVTTSRSNTPLVLWKFPRDSEHVEYLGLQEVVVPSNLNCANYVLEIRYSKKFLLNLKNPGAEYLLYARQARRP